MAFRIRKGISAFLLSVLLVLPALAGDRVRITLGEWPPYISKDLKYYGVVPRIITETFAMEGIDVTYGFFKWKRSYELAKSGRDWDGSATWSVSEDRIPFFIFSDPVIEKTVVFFHLKHTPFHWETIEDLKNITIGATRGYDYGSVFGKAEKEGIILTERVITDEQNFHKLLGRRFDVFVCNITAGYSILNKIYDRDTAALFTNHPKPIHESYSSLILSKNSPGNEIRMIKFNRALKSLKQSGKYDQYFLESRQGKYRKSDYQELPAQ